MSKLKENNQPIGIFDSGVGGLTVVSEIIEKLPAEDIIYLGDTARFPFGSKTPEQLISFTDQICNYLINKEVKIIIIACNSASAAALEWAQEHFDVPIIGVIEPGAKAAFMATINRKIGVIGTDATISSGSYEKAIHAFDAGLDVYQKICPKFADYVENGNIDGKEIQEVAQEYLEPLKDKEVDSLILGCTHYPLISDLIAEVMSKNTKLISSAEETALEVKETLAQRNLLKEDGKVNIKYLSTSSKDKFIELGSQFLGKKLEGVEQITL